MNLPKLKPIVWQKTKPEEKLEVIPVQRQEQSPAQASQSSHSEQIKETTQAQPAPEQIQKSEKGESVKKPFAESKVFSFNSEPENWNDEIELLKAFFAETILPRTPVKLESGSTIIDISKFIHSHFATLRTYNGNPTFKPYLNRLEALKEYINSTITNN